MFMSAQDFDVDPSQDYNPNQEKQQQGQQQQYLQQNQQHSQRVPAAPAAPVGLPQGNFCERPKSRNGVDGQISYSQPYQQPYSAQDPVAQSIPPSVSPGRQSTQSTQFTSGHSFDTDHAGHAEPVSVNVMKQRLDEQRARLQRKSTGLSGYGGRASLGAMPQARPAYDNNGWMTSGQPSYTGSANGFAPKQESSGPITPVNFPHTLSQGAGCTSLEGTGHRSGSGGPTAENSATGSGRAVPTTSQPPPELPPSEPQTVIDNDNLFELQGIKPVFDPTKSHPIGNRFNMASLVASPSFDMRKFLQTPMQPGVVFECQIERAKGGLNSFFPKYVMRTDTDKEIVLMKATKQKKNKTSNYHISYCESRYPGSSSQVNIGKLRSNFLGSEFIAYSWGPESQGLNPNKLSKDMPQTQAIEQVRDEIAIIQYGSSIWGNKPRGPRQITVAVPSVSGPKAGFANGEPCRIRPLRGEDGISQMLANPQAYPGRIHQFHNKPPKWNEQIGAFVLNFNKRVTHASVKNFQVCSKEDPDTIYLQFGRVGKDTFNIDFRWPFSPLQAFALCLSSFDFKLCCE